MTQPKRIRYRGVPMVEGWPEKIEAAQNVLSYTLSDGRSVPRIRYGSEREDWGADKVPCHDCRVLKGEFHVPNCDVEAGPVSGAHLLSCNCPFDERGTDF